MKKNNVYTVYMIAKIYNLRPKMLYMFCRQMGYLDHENMPTTKSINDNLCDVVEGSYGYKACFTEKGKLELIKSINDNNIVMLYLSTESKLSAASFSAIVNRRPLH